MSLASRTIKFSKENYNFLCNSYECRVQYNGVIYRNAEAAYQAQKTMDVDERETFGELSAEEALKKGREVKLRKDWEDIKYAVMAEVLQEKFRNPELRKELMDLEGCLLVDEDDDGEYWGTKGESGKEGKNTLGELLMMLREAINDEEQSILTGNEEENPDFDDFDWGIK